MFERGNQLKGYIQREVKKTPMHSNYAYNYYFCRSFLERLYNNGEKFILKGSFSQFANLKKFTRPITDIDIVTFENLKDAKDMIDHTLSEDGKIKFVLKQRFETTNSTINYRVLCIFDTIQHLINFDLRKEEILDFEKMELPILFSKDKSFDVNSISLEEHLSNKLYICFLNLQLYNKTGKQFRRFKDFYDIYSILKYGDIDIDKTKDLLNHRVINDDLLSSYQFDDKYFNKEFVETNKALWVNDSKKYEFKSDVMFEEAVELTNEIILGSKRK